MRCGDDGRGKARRAGKFALAAVVALGAGSLHGEPAAVDWSCVRRVLEAYSAAARGTGA